MTAHWKKQSQCRILDHKICTPSNNLVPKSKFAIKDTISLKITSKKCYCRLQLTNKKTHFDMLNLVTATSN